MFWTRTGAAGLDCNAIASREQGGYGRAIRRYLSQRCPDENDVQYCERRLAEEERLAANAATPEDSAIHEQLAMVYRDQLAVLRPPRPRSAGGRSGRGLH